MLCCLGLLFYDGVDCCEHGEVNILGIVQQCYNNLLEFLFHPCQFQMWCHHLAHMVLWCRTEVFSVDKNYYVCKGVNSDGICGLFYQYILLLVFLYAFICNST